MAIKKQLNVQRIAVNMFFSIISFVLNFGISFFITPYITEHFGSEAYGFVKLASDFSSYASVLAIALNSMASRFIMIERENGRINEAKEYYVSITVANVILAAVMVLPSALLVGYLDRLISIPAIMVFDVKLTFAITFTIFLLNLAFSTYGNCFYLTNRLDIGSIRDMLANLLRVGSILALLTLTKPQIRHVVIGGLVAAIFTCVYNVLYTHKLIPEFQFDFHLFRQSKLYRVLSAGIWNSITHLSQIFSSGLDLLVTNLLIGSIDMGYLSVAKTVPTMVASFNSTIANVFSPNLMALYANGNMDMLKKTVKASMKFMCMYVSIPCAVLLVMGEPFFELWVPGQPARLINILSVLTIINSCVTGPMSPLYQVFTITNKVKQSSIALIIYGFLSILVTFICLKLTNLGVYAVAGVSLVGSLIVSLGYHLPFSAKYLGLPKLTFLPEIIKSILALANSSVICLLMKYIFVPQTWFTWFAAAMCTAVLSVLLNSFLVLNKEERCSLICRVLKKQKET